MPFLSPFMIFHFKSFCAVIKQKGLTTVIVRPFCFLMAVKDFDTIRIQDNFLYEQIN